MDFIKLILSILIPPLGVALESGVGKDLIINIILTLFGYVPGIIHAVWIIAR